MPPADKRWTREYWAVPTLEGVKRDIAPSEEQPAHESEGALTNMRITGLLWIRFVACVLVIGTAAAFFNNSAWAAKRVALVVGNSAYEKISPLRNPVNDATLVADTLRRLGFDVLEKTDATQQELKSAIRDFGRRLRTAGSDAVGLFYFAGHGVQSGEHNYLIPLGAPIEEEADLEFEAVPARWVLGRMEAAGNALNLVILDACRNNPYKSSFRTGSRGLSRMEAPTGSLIAYSAGPGSVAVDGKGRNSPYALALVDAIEVSGLKVEEVFKKVRNSVLEETGEIQTPWEESSLRGDFYFRGGASAASAPEPDTQPRPSLDERAKAAYEAAERIDTIDAYLVVVRQFPGHVYALLAQKHIDKLRGADPAAGDPATLEAGLSLSVDEIRLIQMGLKSEGHDPGRADGRLGPKTRVALRAWQGSQGMVSTGRLDKESVNVLRAAGEATRGQHRIVGGHEARPGEWPWQVFIQVSHGGRSWACGGSVVASQWVLTAAHCVEDRGRIVSPSSVRVLAGTQNLRKGGWRRDVTVVRSHERYRKKENDIALLRLSRPAGVQPVEIPDAARVADIAVEGAGATVTGWGRLREGQQGGPDRLMEVELPVVGEQACRAAYPGSPIDQRTLCAGLPKGGKDSCQGDSGGPMVMRDGTQWVQVGVVSWGAGCARPGKYGVYMNVGAFADWLQQNSEFEIAVVGSPAAPQPAQPEISKPEPPAPVATTPATERARKLSRLLGRDFSPNAVDGASGWTDLHYAAVLDLPQVARQLLDAGMDVDVPLKEGRVSLGERVNKILGIFGYDIARANSSRSNTPLHWAARGNALETARLLIERGSNIHEKDDLGITPLHYAAVWNALKVVRYLIEHGADIRVRSDYRGRTPLHFAVATDSLEVTRFLVEKGANVEVRGTKYGRTPLHVAAANNALATARFLVERGAGIEAKDNHGITPVLWAARGNAVETFQWLVERGADLNARDDSWGYTALHKAASGNAPEIVRWLLEHGADVNVSSTKTGWTPLHHAASKNALEVAQLLIDRGADVNARTTKTGVTPLHSAAEGNSLKVAQFLVERGADIKAINTRGNTALHEAARGNAREAAEFLLSKGADIKATDIFGNSPLHQASYVNARNTAEFLLSRGANIRAKDDDGNTPLHDAAGNDARETAGFLLSRGADIRAKDNDGNTPLHEAASEGSLETVLLLVQHGADVNATDNQGRTPLDLVADRSEAKAADGQGDKIRKLLQSHGGSCARNC